MSDSTDEFSEFIEEEIKKPKDKYLTLRRLNQNRNGFTRYIDTKGIIYNVPTNMFSEVTVRAEEKQVLPYKEN